MNAKRLLVHFERVADAPDAIPRLRRLILDLAVRGKLVEQDPNDESASELLKRIAVEKEQLVKEGQIQKQKMLSPVEETERPLDLPNGWDVARLATVSVCLDHMRIPINKTEREQRIAGKPLSELFPYFGATQQQGWIDDYIFDEELVLLGEDGIPFFDQLRPKAYIIAGKSWVNNHAHVFRGIFVSNQFLVHCLNVFDYSGRVVGATRTKLNQTRALTIPIMLPPLAEQRRIVAKVDELMALCDKLEAAQAEREAKRQRLTAASLARLNEPDSETFQDDARFALNALPALTKRPDQIQQLRRTILNLAVRGKLVEQDPNDEPAEELLKRIAAKKASLVKNGKNRKTKQLPPTDIAGILADLPARWAFVKLAEISNIVMGQSPPGHTYNTHGEGVPLINGPVEFSEGPFGETTVNQYTTTPTNFCKRGDFLICVRGSTTGRSNIAAFDACIGRGVAAIQPLFDDYYIRLFLWHMREQIISMGRGAAFPSITRNQLENLPVPFPPLPEQHRIVAKVDELMGLCDQLEASLANGEKTSSRLLDSLLAEAIGA